ncbi:MAG: type II secretion system protein [Acidimicrobiales bacterium]
MPTPTRRPSTEAGFTLIEVLVVVMIIAILIAIAVPTFLGARGRAEDRGAQADVRTGYSAARTAFTDQQTYAKLGTGSTLTGTMTSIEPSLTWTTSSSAGKRSVSIYASTSTHGPAGVLGLAELSTSGKCFELFDDPDSANAPQYAFVAGSSTTSCTAPTAPLTSPTGLWGT